MNIPEPTQIPAPLYQRLIKQADQIQSIQQMMTMFQQNCEARLSQVHQETREVWMKIAQETGLDVENVAWAPSQKITNTIVPIQIKLNHG